jgi:hypothetical protein
MKFSSRARFISLSLTLAVALGACGGSETPAETPAPPVSSAPPPKEEPKPVEVKPEEPKYDVDFVEAKQSPRLDKAPRVTIDVPGFNQFLPASLVKVTRVRYKVQGWKEAPEGSYVQFVLDGKPFRPVTDPTEKVMLPDIAGTEDMAEGEHIIAAFVNRKNHESIKSERGIAVRRFYVGKRSKGGWDSNKDPLIVVGSPHGEYSGDVLVDWYVLNATISGSEYSVRTLLKGPGIKEEGIQRVITEWRPWIVLSAHEDGEYSVKIELLDPNGDPVPYGTVDRTFTVKR